MTIYERRALQREWEVGEPGVRYRIPVTLARERVARARHRRTIWRLENPPIYIWADDKIIKIPHTWDMNEILRWLEDNGYQDVAERITSIFGELWEGFHDAG